MPSQVPDQVFVNDQVTQWATVLGCSEADAREDLEIDGSNSPTNTSSQSKRNRNRAKAVLAAMNQ